MTHTKLKLLLFKLGRDERGVAVVMMAIMFAVFLGFAGIVLDGGRLYFEKRSMQVAADAGAMGGAYEIWRRHTDYGTEVRPAVINDTGLNGYNDGNSTITVNNPPASGPNAGNSNFVEVIIEDSVPVYFMRILSWTNATVKARSVAGLLSYNEACVLALDRDDKDAIKTNGNPQLIANCGIMSNSGDPSTGLNGTGSSIVSGTWIGVSGGYSGGGTFTPNPEEGVPPMIDPLSYLDPPDYSGWGAGSFDSATNTYKCPTGKCVFNSEIKRTGGSVTFDPGIYVLKNGLTVTGGDLSGTEVCFYMAPGASKNHVSIGGNGTVQFSAPTSGPMKGILFYGDRGLADKPPGNKIGRGNSNSYYEGALYFPTQHVDWAGNAQASGKWTMLVANTIDVSGTSDVQQINLPPPGQGPNITKASLVE